MDEREIANAGDEFKSRVRGLFGFLVEEFGFEPSVDESGPYTHRLVFRSESRDQLVEVLNTFHGVDYGFEVNIHPVSGPRPLDDRRMIYHKLKEEQEAGFPFLAKAAEALRSLLQAGHAA